MPGFEFGNLFGTSPTGNPVAGPQFDMDATKLKFVSFATVGAGKETAYTVTTGKTLFISKILLNDLSGVSHTWTVWLNTSLVAKKQVPLNDSVEIDFAIPIPLLSGQIIEVDADAATSVIAVIGWEV